MRLIPKVQKSVPPIVHWGYCNFWHFGIGFTFQHSMMCLWQTNNSKSSVKKCLLLSAQIWQLYRAILYVYKIKYCKLISFFFLLVCVVMVIKKILFKFFLQPVHCFHFSFPKSFRSPASQKNKMCTVKITLRTYRQDKAISCYPQSWEKFILVFASLSFVCCCSLFSLPCSKLINSLTLCGSGHHPKGHVSGLLFPRFVAIQLQFSSTNDIPVLLLYILVVFISKSMSHLLFSSI